MCGVLSGSLFEDILQLLSIWFTQREFSAAWSIKSRMKRRWKSASHGLVMVKLGFGSACLFVCWLVSVNWIQRFSRFVFTVECGVINGSWRCNIFYFFLSLVTLYCVHRSLILTETTRQSNIWVRLRKSNWATPACLIPTICSTPIQSHQVLRTRLIHWLHELSRVGCKFTRAKRLICGLNQMWNGVTISLMLH